MKDQRGGRAALGELFQGERVAEQLFPPAAQCGRDIEGVKPGRTQQRIILDRVGCREVVLGGAGGKVGCQLPALSLNSLVLAVSSKFIASPSLCSDASLRGVVESREKILWPPARVVLVVLRAETKTLSVKESGMGIVDFSLDGKVAIVTGGSKGIGRAIALAFAEHGADVVLAARGLEALERAKQDVAATGRRVVTVQADMSVSADCDKLYQATLEAFGGVDILVNNAAGVSLVTLAEETKPTSSG